MQVTDAAIVELVEQISDHYQANIASRYMRPLILQLPIDNETWDAIDSFVGNTERLQYQGFALEELYRQIIALANFIDITRRQLLPGLRNRAAGILGPDKVLMNMSVNTFPSNLTVLAEKISLLLKKLLELDKREAKASPPVYIRFPDIQNIAVLLKT
jgi:hypothetical protein